MELTMFFAAISLLLLASSVMLYLKLRKTNKDEARLRELEIKNAKISAFLSERDKIISDYKKESDSLNKEIRLLTEENTKIKSDLTNQKKYLDEKIADIEKSKDEMALKFRDISSEIIKSQNKQIDEEHKKSLNTILDPLKTQLSEFKSKIETVHTENVKNKTSLDEQLKNLSNLNTNLQEEARNLTDALKGNKKLQGNWGEIQLEMVLELSGLKKDINYKIQETFKDEEGNSLRPDVIINLPNNRKVIVDAKVSLNDYTDYVKAESSEEKKAFLKKHAECIKNHISLLSSKNYPKLLKAESLDYVVIFIPIESAFIDAINFDNNIYEYCFAKNIMIATPSSLLPILRTIENLWKIENQNKNVEEIAKVGASLFDKISLFYEDMLKIGEKLDLAKKAYDDSLKKLKKGKGNAIQKALKLKELGIKTSKTIAVDYEEEDIAMIDED